MSGLGQEMRHAARRLARSPAFTVTAVLTLALGIGANASIFAVVQRVMLNPLPYPDSDQLIELDHGAHRLTMPAGLGLTAGLYFHYSERARTLESAAIYRTDDQTLTGNGDPERVRCAHATPTLGAVLRTPPAIGRWFTDAEGRPGASPVAILSHALWTRRYDANAGILGRPVMLGGVATEIVGVMPASYAFPDPRVDVWIAEPLAQVDGLRAVELHRRGAAARRRDACRRACRAERADRRCAEGLPWRPARARQLGHQAVFLWADAQGRHPRQRRARALDSARVGRRRAVGGLRERRQSVPGAVRRPPARSRRAACAWRERREHRALFPRREHPAVDRRRRDRLAARVGRRSPARRVRTGDPAAAPRDPSRCRRHRLHVRAEPGRRVRVRRDSAVARRRPP